MSRGQCRRPGQANARKGLVTLGRTALEELTPRHQPKLQRQPLRGPEPKPGNVSSARSPLGRPRRLPSGPWRFHREVAASAARTHTPFGEPELVPSLS